MAAIKCNMQIDVIASEPASAKSAVIQTVALPRIQISLSCATSVQQLHVGNADKLELRSVENPANFAIAINRF